MKWSKEFWIGTAPHQLRISPGKNCCFDKFCIRWLNTKQPTAFLQEFIRVRLWRTLNQRKRCERWLNEPTDTAWWYAAFWPRSNNHRRSPREGPHGCRRRIMVRSEKLEIESNLTWWAAQRTQNSLAGRHRTAASSAWTRVLVKQTPKVETNLPRIACDLTLPVQAAGGKTRHGRSLSLGLRTRWQNAIEIGTVRILGATRIYVLGYVTCSPQGSEPSSIRRVSLFNKKTRSAAMASSNLDPPTRALSVRSWLWPGLTSQCHVCSAELSAVIDSPRVQFHRSIWEAHARAADFSCGEGCGPSKRLAPPQFCPIGGIR